MADYELSDLYPYALPFQSHLVDVRRTFVTYVVLPKFAII
jgi:hypothetical protein